MGQGSWVSSIRPLSASLWRMDVGGRLVGAVLKRDRAGTRTGNAHEVRIVAHEMRQPCLPIGDLVARCGVAACENKTRFDLGAPGAANRHPVRRRAVEFHDGAVAFLADER